MNNQTYTDSKSNILSMGVPEIISLSPQPQFTLKCKYIIFQLLYHDDHCARVNKETEMNSMFLFCFHGGYLSMQR